MTPLIRALLSPLPALPVRHPSSLQLRAKTWLWAAPPPRALCVRGTLGKTTWLGHEGSRFSVFNEVMMRSRFVGRGARMGEEGTGAEFRGERGRGWVDWPQGGCHHLMSGFICL